MQRDEFSESVKRTLAARAGHRCSNPECRAHTAGPQVQEDKALNVGVAAHISAAALGGPRYNPKMSNEQRSDISNAIWLCQNCAKLVDNDPDRFTPQLLIGWKLHAESEAFARVGKTQEIRSLEVHDKWVDSEYPQKLGIIKQLEAEGYVVNWRSANEESKLVDIEGWEYVVVERDGGRFRLKIHDHPVIGGYVVLLKKLTKLC